MFFCCECCVLSGSDLCDQLITHPEESYQLWSIIVCDLETSIMGRAWPKLGGSNIGKKITVICLTKNWLCNFCFDNNLFPDCYFVPIGQTQP